MTKIRELNLKQNTNNTNTSFLFDFNTMNKLVLIQISQQICMLVRTKCTCEREGNHLLAESRMLLVFVLPIILLFVGQKKSGSIQRNTKQTLSKIHESRAFSSFMTFHEIIHKSITTGDHSGAPEFIPNFQWS